MLGTVLGGAQQLCEVAAVAGLKPPKNPSKPVG